MARELGGVGGGWSGGGDGGQIEGEGGTLSGTGAGGADMTLVDFDEGLGDGEAQAEAAVTAGDEIASLFESIEEAIDLGGIDTDAGVLHLDQEAGLGIGEQVAGADIDAAAIGSELGGVFDEVPEHLLEPRVIGEDVVVGGVELEVELEVFGLDIGAEDIDDGADGGVDIDGLERKLELAAGDAGEIEQIIDEPGFELHVAADNLGVGERGRGKVGGALEELGGGKDGGEGRAELVAEGGEEAVLGLIGFLGLAARGLFSGKEAFAFFEGLALVVDIGAGAEPFEDLARLVMDGNAADLEPAVGAIGAAEAIFDVVGGASFDGGGPGGEGTLAVVGMHDTIEPLQAELLVFGDAGVIDPLLAEEITAAIGVGGPDELREGLGHAAVVLFALAEEFGLGGGLAVAGLGQDAFDGLGEISEIIAGLGDDVGDAGAKGFDDFGFVAETGDEDCGDVGGGASASAEVAEEVEAGLGTVELIIEDEEVGGRGSVGEDGGGIGGGGGGGDAVAGPFERTASQADDSLIVVEDQHVGGDGGHQLFPCAAGGSLTTCRKKPRRRMASMKASYSTGLVM